MKAFLKSLILLLLSSPAFALNLPDSTARKTFDPAVLQQLREDSDLAYFHPPSKFQELINSILSFFASIFSEIVESNRHFSWGKISLILLFAGVLVIIIYLLIKGDGLSLFYQNTKGNQINVLHEDIHSIDFELLIQQALQSADYRNAIRLIFLSSLKSLSDGKRIHWKPGKTTHEYLNELRGTPTHTDFVQLNRLFEFSWYGGFPVNEDAFKNARACHDNIRKTSYGV